MSLILEKLKDGLPGVTPVRGSMHFEACIVCLDDQKHLSGIELIIRQRNQPDRQQSIIWSEPVTTQMIHTYADEEETTEQAACGIAFLLIVELTEYTVIRRSRKGTRFDYWLGKKFATDDLFEDAARLEVSGIRKAEKESIIKARLNEKIQQVDTGSVLPVYVIIVEFSQPVVYMEIR